MNIFRLIADMLHLAAILVLLYRIKNTRNCIGKCLKLAQRPSIRHTLTTKDTLLARLELLSTLSRSSWGFVSLFSSK